MKILIADDEKNLRNILISELAEEGFDVSGSDDGVTTLELLEKDEFDVLLLDLNMPGLHGIDVLKKLKSGNILTEVIILTGNATVETAVEAMKTGAYDYLMKPFNLVELKLVIEKAYEKKKLLSENALLKTQIKRQCEQKAIITRSHLMFEVLETIRKVAASDFPILIYGETGVGKEHIARAIHNDSDRSEGPFVAINCSAIPENMIESELFGFEKGAFTGAHARKPGLFEMANNGTIFLDEIGDMPLALQVKLLRVVETGIFFRLGSTKELKVNIRFVSATNKDLMTEIEKGAFRQDLYYRIAALSLKIPPLRERSDDIPLLVEHFISNTPSFRQKKFSKEALAILCSYSWPGNIRELQNIVHRTLLLSTGDLIGPAELPADLARDKKTESKRLEDMEREHILKVLAEFRGQKGKAADALGIDPKTLYRKLSSYGIEL